MDTHSPDTAHFADNHKRKLFLLTMVVVVVIGIAIAAYYYFSHQSSVDSSNTALPKLLTSADIKNPIEFFYKNFSAKDYRVRIIDKNSEGYTFYYEKGVIVRIDGEGKYNSQTSSIIKNEKLYSVNDADKTFVEMNMDDPKSTYVLSLYKVGSILDPILQGETPTAPPWSLVSQGSANKDILEYQTMGRKFIAYLPGNIDLVDIKILLDTNTGLISSASIKAPKDKDWNMVDFQYEELNNIEAFKKFPMDYKKVDPI